MREIEKLPPEAHHLPALDLVLGVRGMQRDLRYTDDVYGALPKYQIAAATAFLAIEVYPFASSASFAANLGMTGSFESAVGASSAYDSPSAGQSGQSYRATAYQAMVGPRVRLPLGSSEIGLGVQYGKQVFSVNLPPPTAIDAGVPDVNYDFIRPNLSGRWSLSEVIALTAGVGYRFVLSAGEIIFDDGTVPTYFRKSTTHVAAMDGNLGAAIRVAEHIEVRPGVDVRRYFYSMNPPKSDPLIAGGALDSYWGLSVSAALRL